MNDLPLAVEHTALKGELQCQHSNDGPCFHVRFDCTHQLRDVTVVDLEITHDHPQRDLSVTELCFLP